MRRIGALAVILVVVLVESAAAVTPFPPLTGRVVDNAEILSPQTEQTLTQKLSDYEHDTTNQVVVFTTPSLAGQPIADYSNSLFRHWKIGQKDKDNGVLLVIAAQDHALRIEVGYGLEGVLTDALAQQIIHTIIVPNFKAGQMEQGIVAGTEAILAVLGGNELPAAKNNKQTGGPWIFIGFIVLWLWISVLMMRARRATQRLRNSTGDTSNALAEMIEDTAKAAIVLSSQNNGGNYGSRDTGGGSDDRFSGGGGNSGGGGASGRW